MTIEAAIADLQGKAKALPGMKDAPANPPEAANQFPFAVTYERSGELQTFAASFGDDLATLYVEVHVARQMLPGDIAKAMSFRDPFLKALIADPTLGGAVANVCGIRRTFGGMKWGGVETIGYRFEIDVKVHVSV